MKVDLMCLLIVISVQKPTYCETDTVHLQHSMTEQDNQMRVEPLVVDQWVKDTDSNISSLLQEERLSSSNDDKELSRGHGNKLKRKKIKKKKFLKKILPLLLIPILIQSAIIPLIVMKLKLLVIKAITMGKISMILLAFNFMYTALTAKLSDNRQDLNEAYGYNGGLEFGAFINRRRDEMGKYLGS